MFTRLKEKMPAAIFTVGFIITGLLVLLYRLWTKDLSFYESFVLGRHVYEVAMVVFTECTAGAIAFKLCLKKSEDRDF